MQPTLTEVTLDGVHRTLLLLLLRDQGRVLQTTAGIAAEVAASDVFCLAPIKAVVQVGCCWLMHHLLLREPLASSLWLVWCWCSMCNSTTRPAAAAFVNLFGAYLSLHILKHAGLPDSSQSCTCVPNAPCRPAPACGGHRLCSVSFIYSLRFIRSQSTQAAEQREKRSPGSQRGLLRTYASLAVLRQTALLLRHYGIRCAHLYLRHSVVRSSAKSEMQCEPIEPTQHMPAAVSTSCSWCCMLALQGGRCSAPACRRSQPRPAHTLSLGPDIGLADRVQTQSSNPTNVGFANPANPICMLAGAAAAAAEACASAARGLVCMNQPFLSAEQANSKYLSSPFLYRQGCIFARRSCCRRWRRRAPARPAAWRRRTQTWRRAARRTTPSWPSCAPACWASAACTR